MGVNHSKLNHKVRKVAPLESKDVYVSPDTTTSGMDGLNSTSSFGRMGHKAPTSECQLPPLRETLYGRGSVVPRPLSYDVPLDHGNTSSIIKQHPPRRLQKLEPSVLPSILAAERIMTRQNAAKKEEELGIKVVTVKNSSARRQHFQNMQMQERNDKKEQINNLQSQAESKRIIHREAKINKHKMKEIKAKKVRENAMKSHEDENFLPVEHNETFNMDHGNTWHWNIPEPSSSLECHRGKGKLQMWFQPHHDECELNFDSSSTDSLDSWIREDAKSCRRPAALFRTRTEKIPTFDEFFDREF